MKILVLCHVFNKYGGIINHTEQLIAGLRDIGHTVNFVQAKPNKIYPRKIDETVVPEGYTLGIGSGKPVHQGKGWISNSYSFLNSQSVKEYVAFANEHDIVIHESIFGFANQESEQDQTWVPMITDVKAKQVVIIHDGNLKRNYPWLFKFKQYFSALACVHPAAIKQTDFFDIPRNMILNPFDLSMRNKPRREWAQRENSVISPQTFKSMKHVESLIGAVPYINGFVTVAGDGIERSYMCSKDKCKPAYFATKDIDPDVTPDREGNRMWDNAIAIGRMEYLGFITEDQRDEYLSRYKFLVDSSWSVGYGEHFNRTLFESMLMGAIPIAVNFGVSDNEEGVGTLLKPGINYLMLRKGMTPKEYGDQINEYMNIDPELAQNIIEQNNKLVENLDRKLIAKQYVDIAMGKDSGFFEKNLIGNPAVDMNAVKKAQVSWDDQFEVKQESSLESFF